MSDDKTPHEIHEHPVTDVHETAIDPSPAKSKLPPVVALAFVIIALLGVLIVMVLKNSSLVGSSQPIGGPGDSSMKDLQAEVEARRADVNRQRVAMGRSPLGGSGEPIEDIAGRLKKDADSLVALAARYQQMIGEKDAEMVARSAELIRSEKTRKALYDEAQIRDAELRRALAGGADSGILRRENEGLKSQRDALASELTALREKMETLSEGVSEADYADLQRRLNEAGRARDFFEAKVNELQGTLSKAKLFAKSESDLLPAAVELFRSLRKLENRPDSDLKASYSNFGVDLGATVEGEVSFATGKFDLSAESENLIRKMVEELPDGDLLFVAGYASRTGNPESNQTLSSDRATAVAEYFSSLKRPGQLVQAGYLGQTARFSSRTPERNQICEIWRVRVKN